MERETANDRFKSSFEGTLWSGLIAATVLHFAVFALWPSMAVQDLSGAVRVPTAIELPPEVDIPEPPERLAQPARPVIGDADIDEDVTIASTDPADWDRADLAPPLARGERDVPERPAFVPHTVAPRLLNEVEVRRTLEREYPAPLRDAGIGGRVVVHVFVGVDGTVEKALVQEGSGYDALDAAALAVAAAMRFSPALNLDKPVAVWIQQAFTFEARGPRR